MSEIKIIDINKTVKKYLYVSNNDACEKNIAFYYEHKKNIVIDGDGDTIMFDGDITGFVFEDCENIIIKNISIDYSFNAHFELKISKIINNKIYLQQRDGFEFTLDDGIITLTDGRKIEKGLMLPYDENKSRPDFRTAFYRFGFDDCVEGLTPFCLNLKKDELGYYVLNDESYSLKVGQVLVFMFSPRNNQAFFFENCKKISFEHVSIGYSPSMGIVAQLCEDIRLTDVTVKKNGMHGLVSTCADATHFVNCCRKVELYDCKFFNMLDDGANFHGNYTKVVSVDGNKIIAEIRHFQQFGVNVYKDGDVIDVYKGDTIDLRKQIKVNSSRFISPSMLELTLDSAEGIVENDTLENAERMPEVTISRCRCGDNRPRAFLLTTPKKVVVENCEFSNCAHAIDISGDTTYWFESGRVKDITIRNNVFNVCNYNEGYYPIWIRPHFNDSAGKYYHKNIKIENNTFIGFTDGMVQAANVSGLIIRENRFVRSEEYPFIATENGSVFIKDCENVILKQ